MRSAKKTMNLGVVPPATWQRTMLLAPLLCSSLVFVGSAQGAISIVWGDVKSYADRNGSVIDEKSTPATTSALMTATAAGSTNTTNYNVNLAGNSGVLGVDFSQVRDGLNFSTVKTLGNLSIHVDSDVSYKATGRYELQGGQTIVQSVQIYDEADIFGPYTLYSQNLSINVPDDVLEVGKVTGEFSTHSGFASGTLLAGHTYRLLFSFYIQSGHSDTGAAASGDFELTLGGGVAGSSQSNPVLPDSRLPSGAFVFTNVASGSWVDPPSTFGYEYVMSSNPNGPASLFSSISGFPTGFTDPFTVSVGSTVLGQYNPGDTLLFPGSGVSSFTITGINPLVDGDDPAAFPLQLTYSTPTASFTMLPLEQIADGTVPEPSTLLMVSTVLVGLGVQRWRKRHNCRDR